MKDKKKPSQKATKITANVSLGSSSTTKAGARTRQQARLGRGIEGIEAQGKGEGIQGEEKVRSPQTRQMTQGKAGQSGQKKKK